MSEDTPRTYVVRFTLRAAADIDAAHARFVDFSGEEIADEWKAGLFDAVAPLSTIPHRQIAPENSRFQQEVRQLIYRRRTGSVAYRILFTIIDSQADAPYIRILHVRHGSARPITRAEARDMEANG